MFFMWMAMVSLALDGAEAVAPKPLLVVDDRAYPPFAFLDAQGQAKGITIDLWTLWSRKTGHPVEFRLLPWDDALNAVKSGQADALGGCFRTPARETDFAFVQFGVDIPTGIFFHKRITAIRGLEDIKKFRIGVVTGDLGEELARSNSESYVSFSGVDEMVAAAVSGQINVFIADCPTAWYYLLSTPGGEDFRQALKEVAVNLECPAVRAGNQELRARLQAGFDTISRDEVAQIVTGWTGRGAESRIPWQWIIMVGGGIVILVIGTFAWNTVLRRRVAAITHDLRQSEERFRQLFDQAPEGVLRLDPESGRFVDANPAAERVYRRSRGRILGAQPWDLSPPCQPDGRSSRVAGLDFMARAMAGEIPRFRWVHLDPEGIEFPCEISLARLSGLQSGLRVCIIDLSERERLDAALRQREALLSGILGQMPAVCITIGLNGKVLDWNAAAERVLGWPATETVGKAYWDLLVPAARRAHVAMRWPAQARSENMEQDEAEVSGKDGRLRKMRWYDVPLRNPDGSPLGRLRMGLEITETEALRQDLRRSQNLFQVVIDALPISIWATDREGRLILQNRLMTEQRGDCRGKFVEEVDTDPDISALWRKDITTILDGRELGAAERSWIDRDGRTRWVENRLAPVVEDGQIVAAAGFNLDITERKRQEEERLHNERLSSLGQLAGSVAHDFNNILAAIIGFTNLTRGKLTDDRLKRNLDRILSAAETGREVTAALVRFARQGTGEASTYEAQPIIQEAIQVFRVTAPKSVILEESHRAGECRILGRPAMLQNALLNLCVNARDALLPSGGRLRVSTRLCLLTLEDCRQFTLGTALPGQVLRIEIADEGPGMTPEVLARCLEPFFTTKGDMGTGLGLPSVVSALVDHRGAMRIESAPGSGTCFTLVIPLADGVVPTSPVQVLRRGTVLVADDDQEVRNGVVAALLQAGFQVEAFIDGGDLVSWVRAHPDEAGLAILDVNMPNLEGVSAAGQLRELVPTLPLLVVTGCVDGVTIQRMQRIDQLTVLRKPISPTDLLLWVQTIVAPPR